MKTSLTNNWLISDARTVQVPVCGEIALSGDIGGGTLFPGIYAATSLAIKNGDLILDAKGNENAFWIFKITNSMVTERSPGGNVILKNGAKPAHVFWLVVNGVNIGLGTTFQGTVHTKSNRPGSDFHSEFTEGNGPTHSGNINKKTKMKKIDLPIADRTPRFGISGIKRLALVALLLIGGQLPLVAQEATYDKPNWWFGIAAGANLNFYQGTTQQLTQDFMAPTAFRHGDGVGLYLAPLVEFHRADSRWGLMLQAGYDSRRGAFDQVLTPCNCPADLSTDLSYISVEPSIRYSPLNSNLYFFAGPRFAWNHSNSFTYEQGVDPLFPDVPAPPDVEGSFSDTEKTRVSLQVGVGYELPLSSGFHQAQWVLSPFISFHPYFGQNPRSTETWTMTTLRAGAAIKFGKGKKAPISSSQTPLAAITEPRFTIHSPENIPVERRVRETFPVRNYVFFDLGSTEIPDRYVLLTKGQVVDFKESQLEVFKPKRLSGRSDRQMIVYYNLLNILGDRMGKNPMASIQLIGSSEKGADDGMQMAESVKKYLVEIFSVHPGRIKTSGQTKPTIPSEQPGATKDLVLLREGDRRVSIVTSSPALLMEFQSGPDAPLKPVEIVDVQVAPIDSYVTFHVVGAKEAYTSWSLEIKDETGSIQNFGPYTEDKVSIPGKNILGTRPEGNFSVTMTGSTRSGKTVRKELPMRVVLWVPSVREEGIRFSVIYEFNDSKAIGIYEKYLSEVVMPQIPPGAIVILHGYTDTIGSYERNEVLSLARANDVKAILERSLQKAGRNDISFMVYGFGEDESMSPFNNGSPEERFYNRTVLIDIIPPK
jgi:hypothetical protein